LRAKNVRTGFYNPGEIQPGPKRERAAREAAEDSAPKAADTVDTPTSNSKPSGDTQDSAPKKKAPDRGPQSVINMDGNIDNGLSRIATSLGTGFASIDMGKKGLTGLADARFGDVADNPVEAARWLMSQANPAKIREVVTGDYAAKAAEALSDEEAVDTAIRSMTDGEDFFDSGQKIGGQTTTEDAVKWATNLGNELGDLAAMKEGFAADPGTTKAFLNHRGLMPVQTEQISNIMTPDQYAAFVEDDKNSDVVAVATNLATGDDRQPRSLATMSQEAGKKLDAIDELASARDKFKSALSSGKSPDQAVNVVPREAWKTLTGSDSLPSPGDINDFDADREKRVLQDAWALAAAGRVVFPKVGTRPLEPVQKQARRPLMSLANTPIHL